MSTWRSEFEKKLLVLDHFRQGTCNFAWHIYPSPLISQSRHIFPKLVSLPPTLLLSPSMTPLATHQCKDASIMLGTYKDSNRRVLYAFIILMFIILELVLIFYFCCSSSQTGSIYVNIGSMNYPLCLMSNLPTCSAWPGYNLLLMRLYHTIMIYLATFSMGLLLYGKAMSLLIKSRLQYCKLLNTVSNTLYNATCWLPH